MLLATVIFKETIDTKLRVQTFEAILILSYHSIVFIHPKWKLLQRNFGVLFIYFGEGFHFIGSTIFGFEFRQIWDHDFVIYLGLQLN